MSSELKPCPFCGEQPDVIKTFPGFVVKCWNCENAMTVRTTPRSTRQHAINVWNQRAERTCKPKHWNNASGAAFARGECSECGGYLLENSETGRPRPYCPHCGAKVVGD